jgi:NDP-sugar pyrophosphorylase family protein
MSKPAVVILAAGIGKRVGAWSDVFSKALLPIHHKPVICHIVDKFPADMNIVVALGHKGETVRTWLETAYPHRPFTFVTVDRYTGEGSGPGYSLLACRAHLERPFVFYAVDTLVSGAIPPPDRNWFGVAEVEDTRRFCSVQVDGSKRVTRIDDKNVNDNTWAFIGLAGVQDHATFWRSLEGDQGLIGGERQVSNGFAGLMKLPSGMYAVPFRWFDTGTAEEYAATRAHFEKHPGDLS